MTGDFCSKTIQRLKYVACDWVASNIAFLLFNVFRYYILKDFGVLSQEMDEFILTPKLIYEQAIIPFVLTALYWLSGFYNEPFHKSRLEELFVTGTSAAVNALLIYLLLLTNDQLSMRRVNYELIIIGFFIFFILLYLGRISITSLALRHFRKRQWSFRTLIIGNSTKAVATYRALLDSDNKYGYNVLGFVEIEGEKNVDSGLPVYSLEQLKTIVDRLKVDQFVISIQSNDDTSVLKLVDSLFHYGIPIKIAPDTLSYVTSSVRLKDIFGEPMVDLTSPVMGDFGKNLKRTFDVIFSLSALIILSPLLAAVALAVRIDSKGPVIYSQTRIGRKRKPFSIYKFRSMYVDAEKNGPQLSNSNDSRITKVGRILRKYRIDELPQFWNVVKGDMSLVGPRPEREYFIKQIIERAPYYSLVHQVKPGITSWGMVKYGYASSVDEMVSRTIYDLIYISNMSISVDAKILIYTIRTILRGSGK